MTIPFYDEEIIRTERLKGKAYAGYFSPNGKLLSFTSLLGGEGHEDWRNVVSLCFLNYVSYIVNGTSVEELKKSFLFSLYPDIVTENTYPGLEEYVVRGFERFGFGRNKDSFIKFLDKLEREYQYFLTVKYPDSYYQMKKDLLLFFKRTYQNKAFFDAIKRQCRVDSKETFLAFNEERLHHLTKEQKEECYKNYLMKSLLAFAKDIYVQYLGYDSLETHSIFNQKIKNIDRKNSHYFYEYPRIITTTSSNYNEKYFNYLVMGWSIIRIPKMYYNEIKGVFYQEEEAMLYHQSEKEKSLELEICSIKKSEPLENRKRYFR